MSRAARISAAFRELRAAQRKEEEAYRDWLNIPLSHPDSSNRETVWAGAIAARERAKREYLEIIYSTGATDGE